MSPTLGRAAALLLAALTASACWGTSAPPRPAIAREAPPAWEAPAPTERGPGCLASAAPSAQRAVRAALKQNPALEARYARIRQAEAIAAQARAPRLPTLDLNGQASAQKARAFGGPGGVPIFGNGVLEQYQLSVAASYEIDLFGRLAAAERAARADASAAREDARALALTLAASTLEAWYDLAAATEKLAVLEDQLDLQRRYDELVRLRFANGASTALDVNQQRQQIESLEAERETVLLARDLAAQRVNTLLGLPPQRALPGALAPPEALPAIAAMPERGLPADLLERRPDLRAAAARLAASHERVAVAVRARLPQLRLSASLFLQAFEIGALLEELFWSAAAAATQPLYQGGRLDAEVARAQAARDEALALYADALLTALGEVEGALVSAHHQRAFVERLAEQRRLAESSLGLSRRRYQAGAVDFLRVLNAQDALLRLSLSLVDARRRLLTHRVSLCRALGDAWIGRSDPGSRPSPSGSETR